MWRGVAIGVGDVDKSPCATIPGLAGGEREDWVVP